ncbi:MAG: nucleotidyltransferase domain-containing protein [Firmicutes bacterium]|nr:nucleotidyltransferase domain-containing protein [Bacillota bacterium]
MTGHRRRQWRDIEPWLKRFRERLEEEIDPSAQVVLFGSYARGEAVEGSDVDLLVILPKLDKSTLDLLLDVAWEVGFAAGLVFSVVPVAREEMGRLAASPFFQSVQAEGVRV